DQIVDFCEYCGGMGNLLMMGHAGAMSHADTVENLTLFANEGFPRLKEYKQPSATATAAWPPRLRGQNRTTPRQQCRIFNTAYQFVSGHLFLSTTIQNYERSSNVLINTAIAYNEQDSSKSLRDPRGLKFDGATQSRRHPGRTARGRR